MWQQRCAAGTATQRPGAVTSRCSSNACRSASLSCTVPAKLPWRARKVGRQQHAQSDGLRLRTPFSIRASSTTPPGATSATRSPVRSARGFTSDSNVFAATRAVAARAAELTAVAAQTNAQSDAEASALAVDRRRFCGHREGPGVLTRPGAKENGRDGRARFGGRQDLLEGVGSAQHVRATARIGDTWLPTNYQHPCSDRMQR